MRELSRPTLEDDHKRKAREAAGPSQGASQAEPILALNDVHSGYGEVEVLKGVSFVVQRGDLLCLIGANGAGKSTLLKTVFGQVELSQGSIQFAGEDISRSKPMDLLRKGISMTPQGRCNFPAMTVRENLEMGAYIRGDDKVKEDIERMMEELPILGEKRDELAGNLSGGQQQILEMACALLLHPKLFLVDEPSLGLAPMMARQVFRTIQQINRRGTTIVLVEQNAKQALAIANRAVVLDLGRVRMEGDAKEIRANPVVRRMFLGE